MSDNTYSGWTNYETWLVNLWMDNDQGSQEYWQETAQECMQDAIDGNDTSDVRALATYNLSERMKEQHEEFTPETTGVYSDLLSSALGRVDWYEIAKHYMDDIDLYSAGWNMPGFLCDSEPTLFLDSDDALEYIADSAKDSIDTELDDNEQDKLIGIVDSWKSENNGEFGCTFGQYHYFVNRL